MNEVARSYAALIDAFLSGGLSATQFERQYLEVFKAEKRLMDEHTFRILNTLFTDIDEFVDDPGLYRELIENDPSSAISEDELREAARAVVLSWRQYSSVMMD